MPEYPDITIYIERLEALLSGQTLEHIRIANIFFLRTVDPPIDSLIGVKVLGLVRIGKRIVFVFPEEHFFVLHLMIAGRLHWRERQCKIPAKLGLAAFDFANGTLLITEAGTKKRASLHLVHGSSQLNSFDRGGLEIYDISVEEFAQQLARENHTLKRALTDPRLFSGIGNAYSDEILHCARMSPIKLTKSLNHQQVERLFTATRHVLREWTERLRQEAGEGFPEKVTAFHKEMAVHGRFGQPCPVCGTVVQRIRYSTNETNYCPTCQTGGRLLADRSLSRLLKKDWPRTIEDLEGKG